MNRLHWASVAGCSAAIAAVGAMIATANGAGLTPDSAAYLASGYNLVSGSGLRTYTGHVLTVFPPGLAIVAAFGEWMHVGGERVVRVLNALSFSGAVVLGFVLLRRHVRSDGLVLLSAMLLSVGLPLLTVASMVYSDPVFIVVCLGFILALERTGARDSPFPVLLAAAVLVWAGFLFRYAGLVLIPAGAVSVLLVLRPRGWRAAIRASAAFSVVAALVPALWMLRNRSIDGTFFGARGPSTQGIDDVIFRYVATLGQWVLPHPTPWRVQLLAGAILVLGLSGWVLASVVRHYRAGSHTRLLERRIDLLPTFIFVVVYSLYLAAAELTTALDPIDGRLLSPAYAPLLVLASRAAEGFWKRIPNWLQTRLHPGVVALLALFVLGQAFASVRWVQHSARSGLGFASATWQSSGLIAASQELSSGAYLFSNFPDAMWAVSPGRLVQWVPRGPDSPPLTGDPLPTLYHFLDAVACSESYLIWFDETRLGLRSLGDLRHLVELITVSRHTDGTIYSIRALPSDDASPASDLDATRGVSESQTAVGPYWFAESPIGQLLPGLPHAASADAPSPETTCDKRKARPG